MLYVVQSVVYRVGDKGGKRGELKEGRETPRALEPQENAYSQFKNRSYTNQLSE